MGPGPSGTLALGSPWQAVAFAFLLVAGSLAGWLGAQGGGPSGGQRPDAQPVCPGAGQDLPEVGAGLGQDSWGHHTQSVAYVGACQRAEPAA